MAPEIVFGERPIDGRADLYSLACTRLLGRDRTAALRGRARRRRCSCITLQTPPVPPSQVSELPIPKQFETILMTCLEKDPANRFSSALEVDAQLAEVPTAGRWTQERARGVVADACPEL